MRAIVGVQVVRSGEVTVLGEPAGSADLRHRVGYVTQAPERLRGPDRAGERPLLRHPVRHAAAPSARPRSPTSGWPTRPASSSATCPAVSSGRVSLACALVGSPEVLVLDEPTVGLDPVLRVELWNRFHALADAGTTLIVSSHVMDEAGRCDRLLLLRDGDLIADSTPAQLRTEGRSDDLEQAFLTLITDREGVTA